ncbi:hypothetical protein Hypma_014896 [Hypsizygus marmoreus]|uniref:F-box domain-containing protein n=1 Tax=Hypsizygus marmoreus TaxID=39966 RepID=A0A369K6N1_HYPMA|nr:hypothetical protein Hypma_014896 [Hypsizygus marmoreus]
MELESLFADKLLTNYAPSELEIRQIHTLIREAETEQSRLQALLDGFLYQKAKIDEHIRTHRALLAGIRQLPTELLQKIFVYCLPSEGNTNVRAKEAPLLLGRVCRAWRQLSLSVPDLWSSLRICPPLPNLPTVHQMYGDGILAWINRSGVLPLSISFIEREPSLSLSRVNAIPHELPRPTIVLDTVMQFSCRWRNMQIELYHPQSHARLTLINPEDVPMLEEVKIERLWRGGWGSHTFLDGMLGSSSIRRVSFLGSIAMPSVSVLPPHWKNLTELRMDSSRNGDDATLTPATALGILSHCRNIVVCTFSLRSHGVEFPTYPDSLILPCLERLEIRYHWITAPILDIFRFFGTLDPLHYDA